MSDFQQQPDWWLASDGKWYPPQPMAAAPADIAPALPGAASKPWWKKPVVVIGGSVVALVVLVALLGGTAPDPDTDLAAKNESTESDSSTSTSVETTTTSSTSTTSTSTTTTTPPRSFDRKSYAELVASPDSFKGSSVNVVGKVFSEVEAVQGGIGFQMWANPKASEWNTIVFSPTALPLKSGDFVRVEAVVMGKQSGQNAFSGTVTAPVLRATKVEVVDAVAAATPADRTAGGGSQTQHGLTIAIDRVEFASDETRVFVTVTNGSDAEASFYSFNAKATQGSQQFDSVSAYDYPKVASDILPGIKSSGILAFPPIGPGPVTFVIEGRTDNYRLDFEPYRFNLRS